MGPLYPLDFVHVAPAHALAALRSRAFSRNHDRLRDPRAAPKTIHKNISIAETCRFYGVADSLTLCRVPRSCADCVQMPGCGITYNGVCESVSAPWFPNVTDFDYRLRITPSQPNGTAYNVPLSDANPGSVFTGNVTICPASDPVCSVCRQKFQAISHSTETINLLRTQFCVGTGGCVCIAICEVPEVHAVRAQDTECDAPSALSFPAVSTLEPRKLPSFTMQRRDPRVLPNLLRPRPTEETCGFYGERDMQGCRPPRRCSDCLERPGCMVTLNKCGDMSSFHYEYDFRNVAETTYTSFPSTNTTYCSAADPSCSLCRANWETRRNKVDPNYALVGDNTSYCIGDGGCVCIELCENDAYFVKNAQDKDCFQATANPLDATHTVLFSMVLIVATFMFWIMWDWDERSARPTVRAQFQALWRHMLDQAPALHLDLFGWRRFHQELLVKEQELLAGVEDVSPVARPVEFDFVDPSAPEFDDDESSAPTATNPTALASAPLYRPSDSALCDLDASVPTAPGLHDQ